MTEPMDARATLCLACGLCCDGNLFTQVPLRGDEVEGARRRGLEIVERAGGSALRQRCGALAGCRCEIYEERPEVCRSYRCMLYTALAEGEVSLAEAHTVVEQAHALLAAVADELPAGEGAAMQRARQAQRDEPALAREAVVKAAAWLSRHFHRA